MMKWFITGIILMFSAFPASGVYAYENIPANAVDIDSYDELLPQQKRLFNDFVQRYSRIIGKKTDPKQSYETSPVSVRTTFDAVTQALLVSKLTDENGKSLGTSLDLIDALETIRGKVKGEGGDVQFRIYIILKPDAYDTLKKSSEYKRAGDNSVYHKGYPISFRQQGGVPSIQISMSRDKRRADIDVDYRSSGFPKALFNGHLTAGNSDVRVGKNYPTHIGRWAGLDDWWTALFDIDSISDFDENAESDKGEQIPKVPRSGKTEVQNAVADYLNALLVEGKAGDAVSYISDRAYPCWELKGETDGKPFNRGLAPYVIRKKYEKIYQSITRAFGKITNLKQIAESVRINDKSGLRYVEQPFSSEFSLYDLQEGEAVKWACSTRLTGDTPKKRNSKKYGKYYLAVFRVPPQGQGGTIALLLARENDYWKIITFEDEADVDYSRVPDLRARDKNGKTLKTTTADKSLLGSMRDFHRSWFINRNYSDAAKYFSPEVFACRNSYLEPGDKPAKNFDEMMEGWRKGMRETAEEIGIHKRLSTAITSVAPTTNEVAIVKHPDQKAFTIFALSDKSGEAAACSGAENDAEKIERFQNLPAGRNYYAASFTAQTSGGNPGVLTTLWSRIDGNWRIYSYRIDTP